MAATIKPAMGPATAPAIQAFDFFLSFVAGGFVSCVDAVLLAGVCVDTVQDRKFNVVQRAIDRHTRVRRTRRVRLSGCSGNFAIVGPVLR